MAVTNGLFIFEVVVENVNSMVESRLLTIRSDFADIFSMELKDPKQLQIVMPEPPPLPPEPPGKKKKKPPKPKKGKKGAVILPPPEPVIQAGQSVMFSSNAPFLIQSMKKFPMEVSLWSKEEALVYIGGCLVPWDPAFLTYLDKVADNIPSEPITLNEEYNIFEEGKAKLMAKIKLQIKLNYLGDKCTTCFRTLSEDPNCKKVLYTGINSKTTSYMCTLKTTDEAFAESCNKIANTYTVEKHKSPKAVEYADFTNAPSANLTFFGEDAFCCLGKPDYPPESIYKAPETCPDINRIVDYVRKIIVSCNDNMRMLTPRPTIHPRIKATDIDRFCYCKETAWPEGELAQSFKKEVQLGPCPVCITDEKKADESRAATFDLANIRGPCGKVECKVAREMRAYIEKLVNEDKTEVNINEIIGPCGTKTCTLAEKIQQFLRKEGVFKEGDNLEGLSTQCACIQKMQDALVKKNSCHSVCSKDCEDSDSETQKCEGKECPFSSAQKVFNVYYFTVEHDLDKKDSNPSTTNTDKSFKYCSTDCPSVKSSGKRDLSCSKSACTGNESMTSTNTKCRDPECPDMSNFPPSPADSDVGISFDAIHNPCCVKSCGVAEKVKDFIAEAVANKEKRRPPEDTPCYCDCVCTFKFSSKTTYCQACGGYECLGDDMKDQPPYIKPHPCPVYHKLYDRSVIKTQSPWPEEKQELVASGKSSKSGAAKAGTSDRKLTSSRSMKSFEKSDKRDSKKDKRAAKAKSIKKSALTGAITSKSTTETQPEGEVVQKKQDMYPYPPVPKHMGWNWAADDIPGMKVRPQWKPGAVSKFLLRMYRAAKVGGDVIAKKKRAMMNKRKKVEKVPTLVVTKRDGEYTVQMEPFREYSKPRLVCQNPYDETKPPLVYTIGKTEEEKIRLQNQRDRRERREDRRKSRLIQSTFRDKCQEICLKAYNQAIGLLPLPNPDDPECPCQTAAEPNVPLPIDSCSCSEEGSLSESDTDNDEWTVQFSPPAARYDAQQKPPPALFDAETQYTYLDYKVKLLDKQGNQVPRFFKGPDGKQECSDLGGFWGPGHVWLEINKDGFIGADGKWAPVNFYGPDGMYYTAEDGTFTDGNGQLLKLGIDGWIDKDSKWVWYPRRSALKPKSNAGSTAKPAPGRSPLPAAAHGKGDSAPPKNPPKLDKEKPTPKAAAKTPAPPRGKVNAVVMSASVNYLRSVGPNYVERLKIDSKKIAKYREIMHEDIFELKPLMKTNRACNTLRKNPNTVTCPLGPAKSAVKSYQASSYSSKSAVQSRTGNDYINN